MTRVAIWVVLLVLALLTGCARAPELPEGTAAAANVLIGPSAQDYLHSIATHDWNDDGKAAGATLTWIATNARSDDPATAEQAGHAARAIATFLVDYRGKALKPRLAQAMSTALVYYQPALVGDDRGMPGFEVFADIASVRHLFAVLDGDTAAGVQFTDAANEQVRAYLRGWADGVVARSGVTDDLLYATRLAGVVVGGQRESGNDAIETKSTQHWINLGNYEVARIYGAKPGDGYLVAEYFTPDGVLKSPDEIPRALLDRYSTALDNFALGRRLSTLANDFDDFDAARDA